jgi:hypothetical protein
LNSGNGREGDESDDAPMSEAFENISGSHIHLGARKEPTDQSIERASPRSDISNTTSNSQTSFTRALHKNRLGLYYTSSPTSGLSRLTPVSINTGLINSRLHLTSNPKEKGKFVWKLFKLNYRMLISLALTLFVAIFVFP